VGSRSSRKVVYAAVAANAGIAVSKYVAAGITRSPAMLAEAFHSTGDTGNELLLLFGMKRSARTPDELHPFGHGKALYFYSLLVAVFIFGSGAVLAAYQGVSRIIRPELPLHAEWNYIVLGIAFLFEGYSWRIARRELTKHGSTGETAWQRVVRSKDPTVFTIFLEDTAALIGIVIAFLGVLFGHLRRNPYFDPVASILIAILLVAVAVLLARESGALLVGESANRAQVRHMREIIRSDKSVEEVGDLLTMHLGPEQVLLAVDIKFRGGLDVRNLESAIDRIEGRIKQEVPMVKRIFIEAESLRRGERGKAA
jgi:cation diffusion facilitator family transporter